MKKTLHMRKTPQMRMTLQSYSLFSKSLSLSVAFGVSPFSSSEAHPSCWAPTRFSFFSGFPITFSFSLVPFRLVRVCVCPSARFRTKCCLAEIFWSKEDVSVVISWYITEVLGPLVYDISSFTYRYHPETDFRCFWGWYLKQVTFPFNSFRK